MKLSPRQTTHIRGELVRICNAVCHVDHGLDEALQSDSDALNFLRTIPNESVREYTNKWFEARDMLRRLSAYAQGYNRSAYQFRVREDQPEGWHLSVTLQYPGEQMPWPCKGDSDIRRMPQVEPANPYRAKLVAYYTETARLRGLYQPHVRSAIEKIAKCNTVGQVVRLVPDTIKHPGIWPDKWVHQSAQESWASQERASQLPKGVHVSWAERERIADMLAMYALLPNEEKTPGPRLWIAGSLSTP